VNERLPSALSYVLTGLTVALLAAGLGLRRPWEAAGVWSLSLLPFAAGSASTDMVLTLFETVAVLRIAAAQLPNERDARRFAQEISASVNLRRR
jgi:4-amino-4-deoxy-L-arabinose transferase-like glycosyltransferase